MTNSLRTVLWDANGLTSHKLELQTFLNIHKIDIALISETHYTTRTMFRMPNYNVYHIPHTEVRAHVPLSSSVVEALITSSYITKTKYSKQPASKST
jgi:hypothetical protein